MSFVLVQDAPGGGRLARDLVRQDRIALDCEAAGFHRYSDRLCLLQITTSERTYIVDPLAFDAREALAPSLEDPAVEVVMHGADYDLRLLDRDLGIGVRNLFDTQIAASLTGEASLGLAALLESHLGVRLSKKYQRADWAQRPLPDDMLAYAADDTRHLHRLATLLARRLEETNRTGWAEEEFRLLEEIRWDETPDEDPVLRVRGARELDPRQVTALREALAWRDRVAEERDRAPFRIAGDQLLLEAVQQQPVSVDELSSLKGMNARLARVSGQELIDRLHEVRTLPDSRLVPYPPRDRSGPGRPPPEVEELAERLKAVRNRRAEELKLARGTVLPNATLVEIARRHPRDRAGLLAVPGVKRWQVEALGEGLLAVLNH